MQNPIKDFTKRDWIIWIFSVIVVTVSCLVSSDFDVLTLITTLVGVTSLIFVAKGKLLAPILSIFFCILYAIVSYRVRYWGEMITYLFMSLPMAIWSTVTWVKNQSSEKGTVAARKLTIKHVILLFIFTIIVTVVFYFILKALDTPNLIFSTISIATSFLAASLTMLRSSFYAIAYSANDIVLIVLWILVSISDPRNIGVVANFVIFLLNDIYGFINWRKREKSLN